MSIPEVTIIVPVYNAEKYLSRCIDSIIAQTFTNFECILIDDGSSDRSLDICKQYRLLDERIVLIHQDNSGISASRNKGLKIARGKYVCFVDSDDNIKNNMYEKLVASINNSNADVVCCGYIENDKECSLCSEDFMFSNISSIEIIHYLEMQQAFGIIWNKLYRKTCLDEYTIRFHVPVKLGEDMLFNLQYFRYVKTVYVSADNLYYYLHDNQSPVTKAGLTFDECAFRFENVSNLFLQIDNNAKSDFCAELLAKDFKYTFGLLLKLYSEKRETKKRQKVINELKNFYRENRAKKRFKPGFLVIIYNMLLFVPSRLFDTIFHLIFLALLALLKIGNRKSRFVNK